MPFLGNLQWGLKLWKEKQIKTSGCAAVAEKCGKEEKCRKAKCVENKKV